MKGGLIIQFRCLSNTATLVLFSASRSNFVFTPMRVNLLLLISRAPSLSFLTCSAGGRRTLLSRGGHRRSVRGHSSSFRPVQIAASRYLFTRTLSLFLHPRTNPFLTLPRFAYL